MHATYMQSVTVHRNERTLSAQAAIRLRLRIDSTLGEMGLFAEATSAVDFRWLVTAGRPRAGIVRLLWAILH